MNFKKPTKINGRQSYTVVDPNNSNQMIGSIELSTIFSPSTKTCTITSIYTGCKGMEAVFNEKTVDKTDYKGYVWQTKDQNDVTTTKTFAGVVCTEFDTPFTSQETIQM